MSTRGRAIAVKLNDRIDYFGQDVNIAARVQGLANVNEVCISETAMELPGVGDIVKGHTVSRDYENLKGVGQKMQVHRLTIAERRHARYRPCRLSARHDVESLC